MIKLPKQIVLIRHGESHLNVAKAHSPVFFQTEADRAPFLGVPDHKVDLTQKGEWQARVTGRMLHERGLFPDFAYHSGYRRTMRTHEGVLAAYSEPWPIVKCSIFLREREPGYTYNITKVESEKQFPWLQEYWQTHGPVFARPPGGESVADVVQRVQLFQWHMHEEAAGKVVFVNLHGRVLASMRFLYEGWGYAELEQFVRESSHKNCGVTIYEYSEGEQRMVLKEYNTCYWE